LAKKSDNFFLVGKVKVIRLAIVLKSSKNQRTHHKIVQIWLGIEIFRGNIQLWLKNRVIPFKGILIGINFMIALILFGFLLITLVGVAREKDFVVHIFRVLLYGSRRVFLFREHLDRLDLSPFRLLHTDL
jgi:hypothetical protein